MRVAGIIPARYGSSRFPGKPLAMIGTKTMIQRTCEQALKSSLDAVVVDMITDIALVGNITYAMEKTGEQL